MTIVFTSLSSRIILRVKKNDDDQGQTVHKFWELANLKYQYTLTHAHIHLHTHSKVHEFIRINAISGATAASRNRRRRKIHTEKYVNCCTLHQFYSSTCVCVFVFSQLLLLCKFFCFYYICFQLSNRKCFFSLSALFTFSLFLCTAYVYICVLLPRHTYRLPPSTFNALRRIKRSYVCV